MYNVNCVFVKKICCSIKRLINLKFCFEICTYIHLSRQFTPKATSASDKVLFMDVSSHYMQVIIMQMYLQGIPVKIPTFGPLRIIELF